MKNFKITALIIGLALILWFVINQGNKEEWEYYKQCYECSKLEDQKMTTLIGSIIFDSNQNLVFTEESSFKKYKINLCDHNCEKQLQKWFESFSYEMSLPNNPIHFKIEGKIESNNNTFTLHNANLAHPATAIAKLIRIEGGNKLHVAKLLILEPLTSSHDKGDTISLVYYNYLSPKNNLDTVLISYMNNTLNTNKTNFYNCPNYDGTTGIKPYIK